MKESKISIDKFKIFAAILIIAIHTYPFTSVNTTFEFIFTHVLCRIGVPFFLMATGYFVLPKAIKDRDALVEYTKKILKIYAICIVLYFPVNIYAGKLKEFSTIGGVLKEILINGTFYHLWYFPALILGIWVTYFIIKNIKNRKGLVVCIALFIIGLFGDSYYGLSEKVVAIKYIYNAIFNIFEYTRNGLFFVPIFLYLGYMMKNKKWEISKKQNIVLIVISFILMILEGLLLHHFKLQRHDSMYIMLIPTMMSIFNLIVQNNNENNRTLRNISTTIYIMHPIFIIIVRGIAKVVHLQNIMIDNSVIHYLLVVISTVIFSLCFEKLGEKVRTINGRRNETRKSLD